MPSKKIRLLHLIKSLDLGGIEKSTVLYSNLLQEKLDFVGIYAAKGFYDKTDFVNEKIKRYYPPNNIWEKSFFPKNLKNLLFVIKKEQITHLHYHHRIFIPFIFFVKIFYRKIKIIYTHHSVFNDYLNSIIIADKIIALNKTTKLDLPNRFWEKTTIIPHGIQLQKDFNKQSASSKNIGFVGRFVKDKGLIDLIKSFKNVNEKFPDTKLIFVGDGPLKNEMIKYIDKLGLANKVILQKTSISENKIYSNIDILVLPSEKLEGFGLVVLEAMARQIPTVVSDLPALKEIIVDEDNGLILNNNLELKIKTLIFNEYLYNKIQKNELITVKNNFGIKNTLVAYLHIYQLLF